jgi:hypothetical protein
MMFPAQQTVCSLLALILLSFGPWLTLARSAEENATLEFRELRKQAKAALEKGTRWLQTQQQQDGSWRSESYASLERGLGSTALILVTLAERPRDGQQERSLQRGLVFLTAHINEQGLLNYPGDDANYPLYTTSMLLTTLAETHASRNKNLTKLLGRGLLRYQHLPARGWPENDPGRGGWGPGVEISKAATRIQPANVSVTLHVLSALKGTQQLTPPGRSAALAFLSRCQLSVTEHPLRGGFRFTVIPDHPLNKAGWQRDQAGQLMGTPYLSATCDGIASLLLCDVPLAHERLKTALEVLPRLPHARLAELPLNPEAKYTPLDAVFFYEQAAAARVWKKLQMQEGATTVLQQQRIQSLKQMVQSQHSDGSWANPLPWMLEDDPLTATAFAVQALQRWLTEPAK